VGVDRCLLIDTANALDRADIAGILSKEEGWMGAFDLSVNFLLLRGFLQSFDLRFSKNVGIFSCPRLQSLQTKAFNLQIVPQPDAPDTASADDDTLSFQFIRCPDLAMGRVLE
jgi:hypothetical protein